MTDLLYQTDSYLKEFDAVVTAIDQDTRSVVLDRSAFYPGGGGQPYDTGGLSLPGEAGHLFLQPIFQIRLRCQLVARYALQGKLLLLLVLAFQFCEQCQNGLVD